MSPEDMNRFPHTNLLVEHEGVSEFPQEELYELLRPVMD
jgi:hypothetical protein